jgi:hypothetical protein
MGSIINLTEMSLFRIIRKAREFNHNIPNNFKNHQNRIAKIQTKRTNSQRLNNCRK